MTQIQLKPLRISNDALSDTPELHSRIEEDGYLFFRRYQCPDKLLALRLEMLGVMRRNGWLVAGTELVDGIGDPAKRCTEGDIEYAQVYHEIYSLESFHRSAHWPEVLEIMEIVMDGPVLPHPQKIARIWFPKYTEHTTPIHQDFVHFQGCNETYTCWAPVGDCPIELGGLAVLRGSHKVNRVRDHHFSLGAGLLAIDSEELDGDWHSIDYEIGDTLIFNALMIHQALPNVTEDRMRVSLDNRYVGREGPIAEHMLEPHLNSHDGFTWEQVYKDWTSTDLKYYWRDVDLEVVPRNLQWLDHIFSQALERAAHGDPAARHHLERIAKRDPDSDQGRKAAAAVAAGEKAFGSQN